jgi:trans-2,3-dihydro-3-hydroxyanthranilate isomerase
MENWTFCILDVFTDRPLTGNQLAVFEDASAIPDALLQPLALEIGYSESVFVYAPTADGDARIRIFTPMSEVPFAGHPTLGTAVVVAERVGKDHVVLETGRGPVPVAIETQPGSATRGTMQQPIPTISLFEEPDALLNALGVERSVLPVTLYDNGIPHVYVMLEQPRDVAALQPDFAALSRVAHDVGQPVVGINVFSGSDLSWKTRMFAPADGVPEDPATGSAAGPLALHLARHGLIPWDSEIRIAQGAELGRPSELLARVSLVDHEVGRIEVSGFAVAVGGGWFDATLLTGD